MTVYKRYVPLTVTVPALTAIAAPTSVDPALGDVWLYGVELRIPTGHAGLTGIALTFNGVSLVPWAANVSYIVGDDERLDFDVNLETSSGLQVVTYNTDVLSHSFYLRFACVPVSAVAIPAAAQIQAVS